MKVSVLASGSGGNCTLVQDDNTAIIIDMGITMGALKKKLKEEGLNIDDLSGVFITHEHKDHIKGLSILTKNYNLPIYSRYQTLMMAASNLQLTNPNLNAIKEGEQIKIGSLKVDNFSISHDVVDPCGYFVAGEDKCVTVATDLGVVNKDLTYFLNRSQGAVLEANYDRNMLRCGTYPMVTKQRIASAVGHLSNDDTAMVLASLNNLPEKILLAHLSEQNNTPQLALQSVENRLISKGINLNNHLLTVAKQREIVGFKLED